MLILLDEDLLQKIASETGGRYFRARDKEGLKYIYKQIDKLEKSKMEITSLQAVEEKFLPFVLAALASCFSKCSSGLLYSEISLIICIDFLLFLSWPNESNSLQIHRELVHRKR